jgi:hypothetical protein
MITKPLPPKAGYVEVEIDGVRQYKKIPTELDKYKTAQEAVELENAQYIVELDYRLSLIELGVN